MSDSISNSFVISLSTNDGPCDDQEINDLVTEIENLKQTPNSHAKKIFLTQKINLLLALLTPQHNSYFEQIFDVICQCELSEINFNCIEMGSPEKELLIFLTECSKLPFLIDRVCSANLANILAINENPDNQYENGEYILEVLINIMKHDDTWINNNDLSDIINTSLLYLNSEKLDTIIFISLVAHTISIKQYYCFIRFLTKSLKYLPDNGFMHEIFNNIAHFDTKNRISIFISEFGFENIVILIECEDVADDVLVSFLCNIAEYMIDFSIQENVCRRAVSLLQKLEDDNACFIALLELVFFRDEIIENLTCSSIFYVAVIEVLGAVVERDYFVPLFLHYLSKISGCENEELFDKTMSLYFEHFCKIVKNSANYSYDPQLFKYIYDISVKMVNHYGSEVEEAVLEIIEKCNMLIELYEQIYE